ncbi:hypothetical protein SAMN04487934_105155 [Eubacterium ruminantium]|nr:hypothetical protein SAMN04487934_105155 [Eubacterium ruminantium]
MSKLIVCTTEKASVPFTFLNTKVEIYTYEELCFYIYNNTVLISKSSLSEKLFDWLRNELKMPALADRLTGMVNKTAYAQELLVEILNAGNYYTAEEVRIYSEAWQKYKKLSPVQRLKLKADGYLGYRRYLRAANIYDDIIDMADEVESKIFLGNVYHNRAVAAASNFDTDLAKGYFLKAYELNGNEESRKGYFFVVATTSDTETLRQEIHRQDVPDEEEYFEDIMMEIGDAKDDVREMTIFAMLQRAVYNKMNKDMNDYDKRMDIILTELKDNFREESM